MTKVLISLLLCLFTTNLAWAEDGFAAVHSGDWRGVGVQEGGDNWLVLVSLEEKQATVDFPDIPCGGTWEYGQQLGHSISIIERLAYGQAHCFDNSRVVLESVSQTQLIASWFDESGAEIGFAVLHRNDPALNNLANERAESALTRMSRNLGLRGNPACLPPLV